MAAQGSATVGIRRTHLWLSGLLALLSSCTQPPSPPTAQAPGPNQPAQAKAPAKPAEAPTNSSTAGNETQQPQSPAEEVPALPPGIVVGKRTTLPVPGDRPIQVVHASAEKRQAIVYLHGVCGRVEAMDDFSQAASRHATLIAVLGDEKCPGTGRYRWSTNTAHHVERIQAALEAVRTARGGLLDVAAPILFGYSQGASRAELLASRYPERFPLVILGGPPRPPRVEHLRKVRAVAVVSGEKESHSSLRQAAKALNSAGVRARFDVLPGVGHGQYGDGASAWIEAVLDWFLDEPVSL